VIKKEAEKILKYKYLITDIQRVWNVKAKSYWNHFKIAQTIPEQHARKARD
jgi:hypothetical protein